MNRRDFLKINVGSAAACLVSSPKLYAAATKENPNLLIIMTDEHNFRTLGCYRKLLSKDQAMIWGDGNIVETPHIDKLAEEGVLCNNFYASSPVCSPARGSFISGQYPQNTPVIDNNTHMSDDVVSFGSILQSHGYTTGYSGKWHLDGDGKPQWGPERQFGFEDNRYMFNRGHWKKILDTASGPKIGAEKRGTPTYDVNGADENTYTTDWLTNKTIDFITQHKASPFCYMVSYPDPHGPDTVRAPYDTMYTHMNFQKPKTASKKQDNLPSWATTKRGAANQSQYYGMIKCIDDNIARIMTCLDEQGILENTIVVFTSDHGDMRGEHGRQNKGIPLEASAKVPFIVRYPKKISSGKIVNEALSGVDFLPTILGLMDKETAGKEEGRDGSQLLHGKVPTGWSDVTFIRGTKEKWVAAITDQYKLVMAPWDEPWLIDKKNNPDETINYINDPQYRSVIRSLAKEMQRYGTKYNDPSFTKATMKQDIEWALSDSPIYVNPRPKKIDPPLKTKKKKA